MKIVINKLEGKFEMQATNENGNSIRLDASKVIGGGETGFRPMQLLLAAVGGCSLIDMVAILEKQKQKILDFRVEVEADRVDIETYTLFKEIQIVFYFKGEIELSKAIKAADLSFGKYCSVAKTLEPTANITYKIRINEE